jgi:hypothetical protein
MEGSHDLLTLKEAKLTNTQAYYIRNYKKVYNIGPIYHLPERYFFQRFE